MTPPDAGEIRIGTRGSALALKQTEIVRALLAASWPGLAIQQVVIKTAGDKILDVPLSKIGDKGLFTKELEDALIEGRIDLAVHSLKDLPSRLPEGLVLGAVLEREDPRDVLISHSGKKLAELPAGARIGTSSPRRRSQLLALRPDLRIEDLRGNVPTRIEKAEQGAYDGVVLARAGVVRLGLESKITEVLGTDMILPAPGQGAIAVEIRARDSGAAEIVGALDHLPTRLATAAERSLLARLEGGCQVPIGALATLDDAQLTVHGLVADLAGTVVLRAAEAGSVSLPCSFGPLDPPPGLGSPAEDLAAAIGARLAKVLRGMGANAILDRIFSEARRPEDTAR